MSVRGLFFDNTRLKDHRNCNRFYYIRHELGWTLEVKNLAPAFGGSWHSAMDTVWTEICIEGETNRRLIMDKAYDSFLNTWKTEYELPFDEEMTPDEIDQASPRINGVALNMIVEYVDTRWNFLQDIKLDAVEKPFVVPFPNLHNVYYVGRLDKVYRRHGDRYIGEHKTSSLYKKNGPFRTDLVDSFAPNSQVDGYIYSSSVLYGERFSACMIDAALVHKTVHDGFQLIPVLRSDDAIDAWVWEASKEVEDIQRSRLTVKSLTEDNDIHKRPFLPAFRKNSESCMGKYGPCPFLAICKFTDNPIKEWDGNPPPGFVVNYWEPFQFYKLEGLGYEQIEEAK